MVLPRHNRQVPPIPAFPTAHLEHVAIPFNSVVSPDLQRTGRTLVPLQKYPRGQLLVPLHPSKVAVHPVPYAPAGTGVQMVAPCELEYLPGAQIVLGASFPEQKYPIGQLCILAHPRFCSSSMHPSTNEPGGASKHVKLLFPNLPGSHSRHVFPPPAL